MSNLCNPVLVLKEIPSLFGHYSEVYILTPSIHFLSCFLYPLSPNPYSFISYYWPMCACAVVEQFSIADTNVTFLSSVIYYLLELSNNFYLTVILAYPLSLISIDDDYIIDFQSAGPLTHVHVGECHH